MCHNTHKTPLENGDVTLRLYQNKISENGNQMFKNIDCIRLNSDGKNIPFDQND